ncbi:MAG: hypothetical protein IJ062_04920 [Firmicutes bacterium]|nr:hypothetical protein [Bacillota bacterium]
MKNDNTGRANDVVHKHYGKRLWYRVVTMLAAIVVFITTYMLILPAITMERQPICGMEEHTHTDDCYEIQQVLTCSLAESPPHWHSESCYSEEGELICGMEETDGHEHSDECYSGERVLICGLEEHIHTDACYPEDEDTDAEARPDGDFAVTEQSPEITTDQSQNGEQTTEAVIKKEKKQDNIVDTTVAESTEMALIEIPTETTTEEEKDDEFTDGVVSPSPLVLKKSPRVMLMASNDIYSATPETVKFQSASYDVATQTNKADLALRFITTLDDITTNGTLIENGGANGDEKLYAYKYAMPEGVNIPDSILDIEKLNKIGDEDAFYYSFKKNDDGTYEILVKFRDEYIKNAKQKGDTKSEGTVNFACEFGEELVQDDGSVKVKFSDTVELKIPASQFNYPEGSNGKNDISVSKSGSYSESENKVTYEIDISSRRGSGGDIVLDDVMTTTQDGVVKALNEAGVEVIGTSLLVTEYSRTAYPNYTSNADEVYSPYGNRITVTEDGRLSGTLPELAHSVYNETNDSYTYEGYKVTYSYMLGSIEEGVTIPLDNKVNVHTEDENGEPVLTAGDNTKVDVRQENRPMITKSGVQSGDVVK